MCVCFLSGIILESFLITAEQQYVVGKTFKFEACGADENPQESTDAHDICVWFSFTLF